MKKQILIIQTENVNDYNDSLKVGDKYIAMDWEVFEKMSSKHISRAFTEKKYAK